MGGWQRCLLMVKLRRSDQGPKGQGGDELKKPDDPYALRPGRKQKVLYAVLIPTCQWMARGERNSCNVKQG